MVQAGDPLEPRFKMTVGTAQAGGLFWTGAAAAAPLFCAVDVAACLAFNTLANPIQAGGTTVTARPCRVARYRQCRATPCPRHYLTAGEALIEWSLLARIASRSARGKGIGVGGVEPTPGWNGGPAARLAALDAFRSIIGS
jgi:hypothetical protein